MALLLASCGDDKASAPGLGGQMPPPEVSVITIEPGKLALSSELPGRLEAVRNAEVRARVPGVVLQRVFREGSDVKEGDVLFRIDPAPFKAAFDSATAAVARAEALRDNAKAQADRAASLIGKQMISKADYDLAQANAKQTIADVAAAKAALETARLNLGYATVTAPISGRIGRALVTEGALVGQGEATKLAQIQQVSSVYVNFSQSSAEVLRLRQALASGSFKKDGSADVTIKLEDGSEYPQKGHLLFSDLAVDPSTGSVSLRAEIPNPDHLLLPGMYVRVKLEQAVDSNAITVPQRALQRGPKGAFVMLVKDGKVAVQPVQTSVAQGDVWQVTSGLTGGEQVIVEGLQKIQPGAPVHAVPFGAAPVASNPSPAGQ
jgi:membrane fusion protein (multidrug efflux system)